MIRKISAALSFLLLMCMVIPLDNHFFGWILQPKPAFAQDGLVLEEFALYSQKEITLDDIGESRGNIGSNGSIDIKKGASGSVIGSLQAVGDLKNEAQIGIYGDVTARIIEDRGSLSVAGQKIERADLVALTLPTLSFTSAGPDLEVLERSSRTIAPGSYGRFKVKKGAAVHLSSGAYYFVKFELDESATLHLDVGGGAIQINVIEKIKFKKNVDMQIIGGNSDLVHYNYSGTDKVKVEDHAVLRGILLAPSAKVEFKKGSRLAGAAHADSIQLAKGASFRHYAAGSEGRPPTADAGGYQTTLAGGLVELDGGGSSDPDGDALTYHWSFVSFPGGSSPALSDPTDPMPTFTADRTGVYVIELAVNDGRYKSLKDTAVVTVVAGVLDVTDFGLYADDQIKMDEISGGVGHVGANRHVHIEKGPSGTITGDLRVLGHIKNDGEITIAGDVITNSKIDDHGVLTVTGMKTENAALAPRMLPSLSFSAAGPDLKVPESAAHTLVPGAYGRVEVKKGAVLHFNPGSYFLHELKTDDSAVLVLDVSEGGIELNIVKKLEVGKDADLQIAGGGTRDVRINYAGKKEVEIEDRGVLRGTLVAPKARVEFEKDSRLEGAVYAKSIYLDKGVSFYYHQNRPPVADSQTVTTLEDTPASFTLGGSDADGDALTFAVGSQPLHGMLDGTAPDLTYTPDLNYSGTDAFSFAVNDGTVDSDPTTVNIIIAAVNDPPIANPKSISLNEDEPKPVLLRGFDLEGDALAYAIVEQPTHGTFTGTAPDLMYTPYENYNGADSFTFKANDGLVDSQTAAVSITINPINDTPAAVADNVTTDEDAAIGAINVLSNDTDVDGDLLVVANASQGANGAVSINADGSITYVPNTDFNGSDSFTYIVEDGNGGSNTATVNITVNPVNDAPVAGAQAVTLGEDTSMAILLTGSDVDADAIAYAIDSAPTHGTLTGEAPDLTYTPSENFNGADEFSFTVNDGTVISDPATVSITVTSVNDTPVASAGSDQTVLVSDMVSLNGSGSSDVDGHSLSFQWTFLSVPAGSTAALSDSSIVNPGFVPDIAGTYEVQLIVNDGTVDSFSDTVVITADPRMTVVPDVVGQIQADAETDLMGANLTVGAISSENSDTVAADRVISQSPAGGSSVPEGYVVDLVISLGPVLPPSVNFNAGLTTINQGQSTDLSWTTTGGQDAYIDNGIGSVALNNSVTVTPLHTTTYTLTVTGIRGTTSKSLTIAVHGVVDPQPEGSFGAKYEDLVPPDATVDQYDPKRFSIISGKVKNSAGAAISDVSITVHGHPEYGSITTDAQGEFSIPVEGGGTMTVVYRKEGFIGVQRSVYVPWNEIAVVDVVVLITEDPITTTLTFDGDPDTVSVHTSSQVADESGTRALTVVFKGDNQAYLVDENGNDVHPITTITTRATEYTTPESMPAVLPPTSAFTYCAELQVDGAERVRFEKPVAIWVDNFLNFPVGIAVPVGYYNRARAVWEPMDNGVVVQLLDTEPADSPDGKVDALDTDGDGLPDDIDGNGSFSNEVQGLDDLQRYAVGASFWRAEVTHFSSVDLNFPFRPGPGSISPNPPADPVADQGPDSGKQPPDDTQCIASFVDQRGRIFHEDINIPGTDMTLHYAANRVAGYKPGVFTIPASGDMVPESLVKIIVELSVAGNDYEVELPPEANQIAEIEWDGLDNLGRPVTGTVTAHIRIGFVYYGVYTAPPNVNRAFGLPGIGSLIIQTREPVTLWQDSQVTVTRGEGTVAEGWSISSHHQLNPQDTSVLFKGDGTITRNNVALIDTYAGNTKSSKYYSGMGGPATQAQIPLPSSLGMDPQGNLYIFSSHLAGFQNWQSHIVKVDTQGIATELFYASMRFYQGNMAIDPQGNIYWSHYVVYGGAGGEGGCVTKRTPQGAVSTVMGACAYRESSYSGINFAGIHVDNQGNLFAASPDLNQILKRDTAGVVTAVAGTGSRGYGGDGGPATQAQLYTPKDVYVDDGGNIFIAEYGRVRKVDPSGIITTVAGGGPYGGVGDGGPATAAYLREVEALALDAEGNIYFADSFNHRIRKVDNKGIIITVAGSGPDASNRGGYGGDGAAATHAILDIPTDILLDPAGNLFIADMFNGRVRKVNPTAAVIKQAMAATDIAFAEQSGIAYIMSSAGLHLKTIDIDTGIALKEFGYDTGNNLISINDQFGNTTDIERDDFGVPTAIIAPDGIRTDLTIDGSNHLTRIDYADGGYYEFEYTAAGLMTLEIEPQGNRFEHVFDARGRLTDVTDEQGGHWKYTRSVNESGTVRVEMTTAENNFISYLDHTDSTGVYTSNVTDSSGGQTAFSQSSDGLVVNQSLACGMDLEFIYDVDPAYKFKVLSELRQSTPSGLVKVAQLNKTYTDTDSDSIADLITDTVTVNNKTTTLTHNTLQAQKTAASPASRTVTTLYNPNTLLPETVSIPDLFDTNYGYDTRGRLTSIATGTRQTTATYNAQGLLESVTDPENQTTIYSYDPMGRVTGISRPDGGFVSFTYDKNGNMTMLTDPVDVDHGFEFNAVNLNSSYQTPLSGSYRYVYDKDRRLIRTDFPSGKTIINDYADPADPDDKSRLRQIRTPEGNIDFNYLCGTKVESITKDTESITYAYDGKLVTAEMLVGTFNQSLAYTYNIDFGVAGCTYAGGTFNYSYDDDGLLTGAGGFTIARNADNGLPEFVIDGALNLDRTFNGYGEVVAQATAVSSQNVAAWSLTRDNTGRITARIETVGGVASDYVYTYDSMGRLLNVTQDNILVEEYQYDINGTRIYEMNALRGIGGRFFTYSYEDHLLTAGSVDYDYDLDGFLTTKTDDNDITSYTYSSRGELLSVSLPNGRVIEYVHDPLGRRIAKKIDGAITEKYLWQGLIRLLAVYDGADNLLMRFEYADDRMPVAVNAEGVTYYLAYDQVGSLRLVADSAGNVIKSIEYDSFGNILNDSNTTFTIPFGFAGGLQDRDTGLVRFGYRDYDPDVGRWTAKDPIFFAGGDTDLYGYVVNSPVNFFDPWGLWIGQGPPPLPGYNPDTWNSRWDQKFKNWTVTDPETGNDWTVHEEDPGHWRHWDNQNKGERFPKRSKKTQKKQKKPNEDQSPCDPSGDEPEWLPPIDEFSTVDPFGNIRPIDGPILIFPFPGGGLPPVFQPSPGLVPSIVIP